jgi:hypothetical protein
MYVAAGIVTLCNDIVENNVALTFAAGGGGGIYIASAATVYIDAFTLAHVISNTTDGKVDNIDGPYTQQNC